MKEFQLNISDYIESQKAIADKMRRDPKINKVSFVINLIVWIFGGIAFSCAFELYKRHKHLQEDLNYLIFFLGVFIVAAYIGFLVKKNIFKSSFILRDSWILQQQKIGITDCDLIHQTKLGESRYNLRSIKEIDQTPNNVLLYIDKYQAIVIPKSVYNIDEVKALIGL